MSGLDLKKLYKQFLREYIDEKYLSQHEGLVVLGEGFVDSTYIVVFEYWDSSEQMEAIERCLKLLS